MSDKQKTPVQWFEQQLDDLDIKIPFWVFNEAKEMEAIKDKKYNEMLEMLEKLVERLEENDLGQLNAVFKAKQLIKEAKEL
jgi:hypothetical protein